MPLDKKTTGQPHLGYINRLEDYFPLRTHAELLNYDFPLLEGRSDDLKSFMQFSLMCPSQTNTISSTHEGNLTQDEISQGKKMKRNSTRTKEQLINEIRLLVSHSQLYLNYGYLRKIKRHDLLWDAIKQYGGWRGTVEACGYRPILKSWTKEEILKQVREIHTKFGYIPLRKEISKLGYKGLSRAAERKFNSWSNALANAGFKPKKKRWKKEGTIEKLKEIYMSLGHSPSMRELRELGEGSLLHAGLKFFSKYNDFLKAADLKSVLEMNKWTKSDIIKELQKIQEELGRTPRRTELAVMKRYDLINAAETYFPCWSEALLAADIIPNSDVLKDDKTWREWENLIFELLLRGGVKYEKKRYIKRVGYPDVYIPSLNKIIEIKLNCSENSVKKDITNYLPFCEQLEVWYLYGKPCNILSNKVKFIGPNQIKLILNNNKDLLERFQKIKQIVEGKQCETEKHKTDIGAGKFCDTNRTSR